MLQTHPLSGPLPGVGGVCVVGDVLLVAGDVSLAAPAALQTTHPLLALVNLAI